MSEAMSEMVVSISVGTAIQTYEQSVDKYMHRFPTNTQC